MRRVGAGLLAALITAVPTALALRAVTGDDRAPATDRQVWRVVDSQCLNGRIQQGVDTGRPDGLLLAHDTGVNC